MAINPPLDRQEKKQIRNYLIDRIEMGDLIPDPDEVLFSAATKFGDRYGFDVDSIPSDIREVVEDLLGVQL